MAVTLDDKLVVAISSRALFDFEEENRLFDPDHPQSYMQLQLDRLDVPARPGVAFSLVKKLLAFNEPAQQRVEVVVLSRNDPVSGMRVFRSAKAHGLASVQRGVFTQGAAPFRYLRPLGAHLFLSANAADVNEALALLPDADRRAQKPGLMMASIYRTLLREIEHDNFQVLHQRIRLTPLRKFWLAWKVQALGRM